jgi:glyoxylase-like metal-dependent hydrolase (beta-lactamase superfamily II)
MKQIRPDLYAIRGWFGLVHLLVQAGELILMDSGFIGDFRRVQQAIQQLGRQPSDLKAILLTHGHLDHTMNAARLQQWSGAKVYAPTGDEQHVRGCYPYRGVARGCGLLEAWGRAVVGYEPPRVDVWMHENDELPFWGGLRVVSLPGHTVGHCGFYSDSKGVFFVGDLFAFSWGVVFPPGLFNTNTAQIKESLLKTNQFAVKLFVPAHYFWLDETGVGQVRDRAAKISKRR